MKEQNEQRMTDIEDIDSPGMGIRVRTTAPVCYGRNMTFPRPTSSYAHRHELPAIVTEGESCRLLAEVRDDLNRPNALHRCITRAHRCRESGSSLSHFRLGSPRLS